MQFLSKGLLFLSCILSTTFFCANPSMAAGSLKENASTPRAAVQSFISSVERYDFTRAADFAIYQEFKTRQQLVSFLKGFTGPDRVLQFRILGVKSSPTRSSLSSRAFVTVYLGIKNRQVKQKQGGCGLGNLEFHPGRLNVAHGFRCTDG